MYLLPDPPHRCVPTKGPVQWENLRLEGRWLVLVRKNGVWETKGDFPEGLEARAQGCFNFYTGTSAEAVALVNPQGREVRYDTR